MVLVSLVVVAGVATSAAAGLAGVRVIGTDAVRLDAT